MNNNNKALSTPDPLTPVSHPSLLISSMYQISSVYQNKAYEKARVKPSDILKYNDSDSTIVITTIAEVIKEGWLGNRNTIYARNDTNRIYGYHVNYIIKCYTKISSSDISSELKESAIDNPVFCNCSNPRLIENYANNKMFYICKICRKEK